MSGINPLIDTLMHQVLGKRVDTPPPRDLNEPVRPMSPADAPRALHSDSRLDARARQLLLPASALTQRQELGQSPVARSSGDAPSSTQLHLTPSARSIADLLLRFPAPPSVVKPPLPLVAAGQTPAPSQLAERLQGSVRDSGLFYEAHLARWYRGEMPRVQLQREPQMWRTLTFTPVPGGRDVPLPRQMAVWGAASGSGPGRTMTAQGGGAAQPAASAMGHDLQMSGPFVEAGLARTVPPTAQPSPEGSRAMVGHLASGGAGSGGPGQGGHGLASTGVGGNAAPGTQGQAMSTTPAAAPAGIPAGGEMRDGVPAEEVRPAATDSALRAVREPIHESLQGIVRHQLEMLVTPMLRWEGDVWTGIFMALVMHIPHPERDGQDQRNEEGDEREQQGWRSGMTLEVDGFGRVEVNLWLRGDRLDLNLTARDEAIVGELENGLPRLIQRLEGSGLADVRARVVAMQENP